MKKISKRDFILIILLIVILPNFIYYKFIFTPLQNNYLNQEIQLNDAKDLQNSLNNQMLIFNQEYFNSIENENIILENKIENIKIKTDSLESIILKQKNLFINTKDIQNFNYEILDFSNKNNIKLIDFGYDKTKNTNSYFKPLYKYHLNLITLPSNLLKLTQFLENHKYYIKISHLVMNPQSFKIDFEIWGLVL